MWPRIAILLLSGSLSACGPLMFAVGVTPGDQRLRTTTVERCGRALADRVALIDVSGMIYNARRPALLRAGENPVGLLHEKLEMARRDGRVKAVILRLNTPGGTVTASDAMYRQVARFRERTGKPVVALMMDVAASGGYYLACASDRMVAYPTSITGSIGVLMQTISVKPALSSLGVQTDAITTGPNKDAGSPLSTLTPAQRRVLQALVDDFYARFIAVVRRARPEIDEARFAELTDGRVLSGEQAAQAGLVDAVGDLYDAVATARDLAGVGEADLVMYHRPLGYVGSPYASTGVAEPAAAGRMTQINLAQLNLDTSLVDAPVGFYYLWTGR